MAQNIYTQIEINAPAHEIWKVLMNFEEYGGWNPFITSLIPKNGTVGLGDKITAVLEVEGMKPMKITPNVITHDEHREFAWLGRFGLPWIFDGEHHFEIIPVDENRSRFVQRERFRGILVGILMLFIKKSTRQGFEAMNQALKTRVEDV